MTNNIHNNGPKMAVGSIVDPTAFADMHRSANFNYNAAMVHPAEHKNIFSFIFSK